MRLCYGVGNRETRGCWMAALSVYANEDWSDHPKCVPPMLRDMCIQFNDALRSDEQREALIGPILFLPVGADPSDAADDLRATIIKDTLLMKVLPVVLGVEPFASRDEAEAYLTGPQPSPALFWAVDAFRQIFRQSCTRGVLAWANGALTNASRLDEDVFDIWRDLIVECCRVGDVAPYNEERAQETRAELAHWK